LNPGVEYTKTAQLSCFCANVCLLAICQLADTIQSNHELLRTFWNEFACSLEEIDFGPIEQILAGSGKN
jgi:hypothetical protein